MPTTAPTPTPWRILGLKVGMFWGTDRSRPVVSERVPEDRREGSVLVSWDTYPPYNPPSTSPNSPPIVQNPR